MSVRYFVLNQLKKGPRSTESLTAMVSQESVPRLQKTLNTLEAQGVIFRASEVGDAWALR